MDSEPERQRADSAALATGLALVLAGLFVSALASCATTSADDSARSEVSAFSVQSGLQPGVVYRADDSLSAVTRGNRTSLVAPELLPAATDAETEAIRIEPVTAGTRVKVLRIREVNTITHGVEAWPEGEVLDGPLAGRTVALGSRGIENHLRRESP